ncbi:hypothetical protein J6590_090761 [Homalodisca vitripennis]|nr:hypothetical protein J6590_090761 [Homalodisca vitripennis]
MVETSREAEVVKFDYWKQGFSKAHKKILVTLPLELRMLYGIRCRTTHTHAYMRCDSLDPKTNSIDLGVKV